MSRLNQKRQKGTAKIWLLILISSALLGVGISLIHAAATGTEQQSVAPNFVNASDNVILTAAWVNGSYTRVLFCNDSLCTDCWYSQILGQDETSGCWCYNYSFTGNNASCTYQTQDSDDSTNYFYARFYNASMPSAENGTIHTEGTPENYFQVNHRPNASAVSITPAIANASSHLNCTYTFNDLDNDIEGTNTAVFRWWVQDESTGAFVLNGTTTQNFSAGFDKNDTIKCGVMVMDEHGFPDDIYVNSSNITIGNIPPVATNVNITPAGANTTDDLNCSYNFGDVDGDNESGTSFRWYRNNTLMPSLTLQIVDDGNTSLGESWVCEVTPSDGEDNGTPVNSSSITIGNSPPTIISLTDDSNITNKTCVGENITFRINWSDIDPGELARAYVCNESDINESGCGAGDQTFCNTSNSDTNPIICRYALNASDNYSVMYYVLVCDGSDSCSNIMNGTFYKYNDTSAPTINLSAIPNITIEANKSLNFSVSDNTNLNMSSLTLNISNGTSIILGYNLTNMTCTGDNFSQACNLSVNLSDGNYTLSFYITDTNGNANTTNKTYLVDADVGSISTVNDGYYQAGTAYIADITTTNTLFANWTNVSGFEGGVDRYEYAIGTGPTYLSQGWNDTKNWTNVSTNRSVIITLALTPGNVYYFHVRAIGVSGLVTNVTSSDGILFDDTTPPYCTNSVNGLAPTCVRDGGVWTNSKTALQFYLNFTENESTINSYQYAIGTTHYPLSGYDNIIAVTNTTNANVTVVNLSLVDNGTYFVSARARNSHNKWSQWYYSDNITVDSILPVNGSIIYTSVNLTTNTTIVTVDSGYDNLSGIVSVQLQRAEVEIGLGQTCSGFSSYMNYGNQIPSQTQITVNLNHGYCYKFRYLVYDNAGNTNTYYYSNELSFFVDTTPPDNFSAELNHGDFYTYSNNLTANWSTAYDAESGIDYYAYALLQVNGSIIVDWAVNWTNTSQTMVYLKNLPLEDEKQYRLIVRAFNKLGLITNATSNDIMFLDNIPPDPVTIISVGNDTNGSDGYYDHVDDGWTNITVHGEADISCVYSLYDIDYSLIYSEGSCTTPPGSDNATCALNVSQGSYTYYIVCKDINDNTQSADQNTEVSWISDWAGPNITITNPLQNSIVAGVINLTAIIEDEGIGNIDEVFYNVTNLTSYVTTSGPLTASQNASLYSASWNSSSVEQTTYTFTVYANDTLGYSTVESVNFTIDRSMPYLEVYHDIYINGTFNISIIAQVFVNVSYNITNSTGNLSYNNSNTSGSTRNYLSWFESLDLSGWAEGAYNVSVLAVNNNSDTSERGSWFKIDRGAPAYSNVLNTSNMTFYNNESVEINLTWIDANDITVVYIGHNATGTWINQTAEQNGSLYKLIIDASVLENNETIHWNSYALDEAGFWNQTPMYNFTISNRAPYTTALAGMSHNFTKNSKNFTVNLSAKFVDPDGDNLNYSYLGGGSNITVLCLNNDTGIVYLNVTTDWTGYELLEFNATDVFNAWNSTTVNISIGNRAPNFTGPIQDLAWVMNENYSINLSVYFHDPDNDTITYNYTQTTPSNITIVINQTSSTATFVPSAAWFGTEWVIFNATDIGNLSVQSNNLTLQVTSTYAPSTITNSTINSIYYTYSFTNNIAGIINSTITLSNITGSTINNSNLTNCTVIDSFIMNAVMSDCYIDPSRIINSIISGGSNITDSNITDSTIHNTTVADSTIYNSYMYDSNVSDANITNGVIYTGFILMYNNSYYNATLSGPINLTEIIECPPFAYIQSITLGYPGENTVFVTNTTDLNINGTGLNELNDSLNFTWFFGDNANLSTTDTTAAHAYSSAQTFTVTLIATDRFNKTGTATATFTVPSPPPEGRRGGGGGGGFRQTAPSTTTTIDFTEEEVEVVLSLVAGMNNTVNFNYNDKTYKIKLEGLGPDFANLKISPDPSMNVKLYEDRSTEIDLDGDGTEELYIELDRIIGGIKAKLKIKKVGGVTPVVTPPPVVVPPRPPTPPVEEPEPPVEEEPREIKRGITAFIWIPLIIVIGGVLVLAYLNKKGIINLIMGARRSLPGADPVDAFITNALKTGVAIPDVLRAMVMKGWDAEAAYERMVQYVEKQGLEQGFSLDEIQKDMVDMGWDKEAVAHVLPAVPHADESKRTAELEDEKAIDAFIAHTLASGLTIPDVLKAMVLKGWHTETAYSKLVNYIVKQGIDEGLSFDEIKKNMVRKGWDEKVVDNALGKF